ncbi:OsmC family protein [Micromonospora sp. NPDC049559]|uniref:OsmC family protein n=1 Tax=Micromonospora sp. NPDC049559 TaxID=3155923 RepID=UPI00344940BE
MPETESWVRAAVATAEGGRLRTDDGELSTALASPLAPHCTGLAPEQLLAAAFASCLHHAAVEAASEITDEAHTVRVSAEARLGRDEDGNYHADVQARISSTGLTRQQLSDLAEYADRLWPFSSDGAGRHTVSVEPVGVRNQQP